MDLLESRAPGSRPTSSNLSLYEPSFGFEALSGMMDDGIDATSGSGTESRFLDASSPTSCGSAIAVASPDEAALTQKGPQGSSEAGESGGEYDETRSLTDSIRQHITEGGLRYHAYHDGKYAFPNDETEQYRDDLKHNLTVYLCDGNLFYAPVEEILRSGACVLDLGM